MWCLRSQKASHLTWSAQHDVEVHAVDTNAWVVLDAQVDVLLDAEAKVAGVREVVLAQLVLTHLDSNG